MPAILATQEADKEDQGWKPALANSLREPVSKTPLHEKGLVEWLKVKALTLNSRTGKKNYI
jgi:hypothetical protein